MMVALVVLAGLLVVATFSIGGSLARIARALELQNATFGIDRDALVRAAGKSEDA